MGSLSLLDMVEIALGSFVRVIASDSGSVSELNVFTALS